jgi:ATP-binding cassette subfamily C protein
MNLLRKASLLMNLVIGLLIYLVVAFNISPTITFVTLGLGICVFVLSRPVLERIREAGMRRVVLNQDMNHNVSEVVGGMKMVKSSGIEPQLIRRSDALFEISRAVSVRISMLQQAIVLSIPPLGVLYIALIFGIAFRTQFVTLAALPAIMYLIYKIFVYVQQTQDGIQSVTELLPHLQSVLKYQESALEVGEKWSGTGKFSLESALEFDNVSFQYEDGAQALRAVTFKIPKGAMAGLIGPSGAGKTTTVDVILRLFSPQTGVLKIDGVDARDISLAEWRAHIGYVSQDVFLLNDTIRNNIALFNDEITDEHIREAVRLAHFEDVLKNSSHGLDTIIGDRGVNLSAGQRQRLVIARALARRPSILVLDEATSALDNESEEHIKQAIHSLKGKMTIIAIAHRLSTVMDADMLVVLEDGKVTESGPPAQLLKDKDSYFYKVNSIVSV